MKKFINNSILKYKFSTKSLYHPIYFDNQATSPIDFRVLDAMIPYMSTQYGNPHSTTHEYGWQTKEGIEKARKQVANLIKADSREIIFMSGATESNNTALIGASQFYGNEKKNHIISTKIEHKTVLETLEYLKKEKNFKISFLDLGKNGLVNMDQLREMITPQTLLVSIMALNNEIGVIQDIQKIGEICKENNNKVLFHTDAAQALGKLDIDVNKMQIDLMSITAHKMYGPKGIGALYVKRKPKVRILPLINGGGQERGLRSGTLPPYLCIGLGEACQVAFEEWQNDLEHVNQLFNYMKKQFESQLGSDSFKINGDIEHRYLGNMSISFKNIVGEDIQKMLINEVALSAGAACIAEPSYVLSAIQIEAEYAQGVLRLGIGRFTTKEEVEFVTQHIINAVQKLQKQTIK